MNNPYSIQSIQELLFKWRDNASRKLHGKEKSSFLYIIDLQLIQKAPMSRNGYIDAERAQCVLCITEWYGKTESYILFMQKYVNSSPARSMIQEWYEAYQSRGSHAHKSGNGHPLNKIYRSKWDTRTNWKWLSDIFPWSSIRKDCLSRHCLEHFAWRLKTFSVKVPNEHGFNRWSCKE